MHIAIYMDQIPEENGIEWEDYPEATAFILDDLHPKRDPVTLQLIRPPRRTLIYPEDITRALKGEIIPYHRFIALLRNGNKLLCPLCRKGRICTPHDPNTSHHFFCDDCGADLHFD